jgi:hypothetical protein
MLVYMVYDKRTGDIVHVHRAVDAEGRSEACSTEEVLAALPGKVDAKNVGVVPAEFDEVPSGRDAVFSVDVKNGALVRTPVQQRASTPAQQTTRRTARKPATRKRSRS